MKKQIPKIIGGFLNLTTPVFPRFTRNTAFNLLCQVKRVPISEDGGIFFSKGETTWMEIAGYKTALHKWGHGPKTVMFMHGWMSHSQRWKNYVGALDPEEYTCFALDAPGHGSSEGNFLNLEIYREAYEQALKITGPIEVLVCHSLGNLVAAYQFLYNPSVEVGSYVVMGSPSGMDAIFTYFVDIMGLSPRMLDNLSVKINEVLKLPHHEVKLQRFFQLCDKDKLVIHEETDRVTPIQPIKNAIDGETMVSTLYTTGLDHTLKGSQVLEAVTNFIYKQTKETYVLERI